MNLRELKKKFTSDPSLLDAHRIVPRTEGGKYEEGNVEVLDPIEHLKHHNSWREREGSLDELKGLVEAREYFVRTRVGIDNQLRAVKRKTDSLPEETADTLKEMLEIAKTQEDRGEKAVSSWIKEWEWKFPIIHEMLIVPGCGEVTAAYCVVYLDPYKARSPSSFWKYVGLDKASHERYKKGVEGGGNKVLRTMLYRATDSMIRTGVSYRVDYDRVKTKLEKSNKITKTRHKDELVPMPWKDVTPGHRDGAARREMMKLFLAHLWLVWRELEGLSTRTPYAEEQLGHEGIISPEDRGWRNVEAKKKKRKAAGNFEEVIGV